MPQALKSCPKFNKSSNQVTLSFCFFLSLCSILTSFLFTQPFPVPFIPKSVIYCKSEANSFLPVFVFLFYISCPYKCFALLTFEKFNLTEAKFGIKIPTSTSKMFYKKILKFGRPKIVFKNRFDEISFKSDVLKYKKDSHSQKYFKLGQFNNVTYMLN